MKSALASENDLHIAQLNLLSSIIHSGNEFFTTLHVSAIDTEDHIQEGSASILGKYLEAGNAGKRKLFNEESFYYLITTINESSGLRV